MSITLDYQAFLALSKEAVQALVDELVARPLSSENIETWLQDWGILTALFQESLARLDIATHLNTADEVARERLAQYRRDFWGISENMSKTMNERFAAHEAILPASLLPVLAKEKIYQEKRDNSAQNLEIQSYEIMDEYLNLTGGQSIQWQGKNLPNRQARQLLSLSDAQVRKEIWHLLQARRNQDYETLHALWTKTLDLRQKIAEANGFDNYLAYRWLEMEREDYQPSDNLALHDAIEAFFSPLYERLLERRRQTLGLESLAPWDMLASTEEVVLRPFRTGEELLEKTSRLFYRLLKPFGDYFEQLRGMNFLDMAMRDNTAPVGGFARAVGRNASFVMLNVYGGRRDVENLVHEMGHAFAMMEACKLPYHKFWGVHGDFVETPSSAMEMLSMPYWDEFYNEEELAQAKREYFADSLYSTLTDAIQDAFQMWTYEDYEAAKDSAACDAKYLELTKRFIKGIDWDTYAQDYASSWQSMSNAYFVPLMSMEYTYGRFAGLNLLKTLQEDKDAALNQYLKALTYGRSGSSKEVFAALNTDFPFKSEAVKHYAEILAGHLAL